jgi:hypothetical protein
VRAANAAKRRCANGRASGARRAGIAFAWKWARVAAAHTSTCVEVATEGRALARKACAEGGLERRAAARELVRLAGHDDAVVDVAHVGPRERAVGDVVEDPSQPAARRRVPDVVHADVPFVSGTMEDVGEPAGRVVALEDEHVDDRRDEGVAPGEVTVGRHRGQPDARRDAAHRERAGALGRDDAFGLGEDAGAGGGFRRVYAVYSVRSAGADDGRAVAACSGRVPGLPGDAKAEPDRSQHWESSRRTSARCDVRGVAQSLQFRRTGGARS